MRFFIVLALFAAAGSISYAGTVGGDPTRAGARKDLPAQIGLISEPIDIEGAGRFETVFIEPQDLDSQISPFANYANTFRITRNPNVCNTDSNGSTCTEMASREQFAKFRVGYDQAGIINKQNIELIFVDGAGVEYKEKNDKGEWIELKLVVKQVENDQGVPKQVIHLVVSSKSGSRKALMTPRIMF
jgi:hypothetical protein